MTDDMLGELLEAEDAAASHKADGCPLCAAIRRMDPGPTRTALTRAAGGTIGIRRLVEILRKNEIHAGRIVVAKHRTEEHTP